MSDTDNFFDDAVRTSAPSFKFITKGDFVKGEIVDQFVTTAKVFAKDEEKLDRDGRPIPQLGVVIQTDLRNWDHVSRVPKVDRTDRNSPERPASEDDGKRTIFFEKWTNIYGAMGRAVYEATGKKGGVHNGGILGVQWFDEEDTGKGQPLKKYRATYTPPSANASGDFFGDAPVSKPGGFDAPAAQAAVQKAAQPAAAQDPWSGQPVSSTERSTEPPF
jgi:hypothetical protein